MESTSVGYSSPSSSSYFQENTQICDYDFLYMASVFKNRFLIHRKFIKYPCDDNEFLYQIEKKIKNAKTKGLNFCVDKASSVLFACFYKAVESQNHSKIFFELRVSNQISCLENWLLIYMVMPWLLDGLTEPYFNNYFYLWWDFRLEDHRDNNILKV